VTLRDGLARTAEYLAALLSGGQWGSGPAA
jgi:hypothetical protein